MADVVACYAVFNEAEHVADSIRSVKAYVDRFVVIDSAFERNPVDATHSTDNTRDVVEELCAAEPVRPLLYLEADRKLVETDARNAYLEQVAPGDWCLVIDGDELLHGDWSQVRATFEWLRAGGPESGALDVPVYTVALNVDKNADAVTPDEFATRPLISTMGMMPRLFRAGPAVRYVSPGYGMNTPVITRDGRQFSAHDAVAPWSLFLVNEHTRQSLDSYRADYVWATA